MVKKPSFQTSRLYLSSWVFFIGTIALLAALVPTASADVSKGNLILMKRGLQVQGMVTKDDVFHLNTYSNAHYTAIHWLWESNPSLMGVAPGFPWARWAGDETNMPPQGAEAAYMSQLVLLQLGDEWNLNDEALRNRAVNWFNAVRTNFPDTILYMNNFGGQVSDAQLADFYTRAKPDMLSFDTYPWRSDYATRSPIGGSPTGWYGDLRRYREHARAANIPFASYVQTFHAVQDYDQTVYRDPSASELRLNHFAALAFNAKALIDFTYNTGASSLFTKPGGDSNPTALYAEKSDIAQRIRNLGKTLLRLKPIDDATTAYTTSMMFIRGKHLSGGVTNANALPVGFVPDDALPNSISDWVSDRNDPYLRGWVVTNKAGVKNNGLIGDVIVSWFKPLDESMDGTNHSNERYIMVVNALSDTNGSAADCLQEIKLNFLNTAATTSVIMLDPATGQLQTNALPIVSTRRQLVLNLNGGDTALFKFSTGAPFVGITPVAARLGAQMQGNTASLNIQGAIGTSYQIHVTDSLLATNWMTLTNVQAASSLHVFQAAASSGETTRFYRAAAVP